MSARALVTAVVTPPVRRMLASFVAFAAAGPLVDAVMYIGLYAVARRIALGQWDAPTLRQCIDDLPDIYGLGIAAALAAGVVVALRQGRGGGATPLFLVATGLLVGLANTAFLLAIAPDFGIREVPLAVLAACHAGAFMLTTIVCWRLGVLLARALSGLLS